MTVIKNDVINEYTNSGSDRYSITFEYDRPEQVTVRTYNSDTNEYEDVTDWVFDGATAIRFTDVVPDTFEIVRVTNISQSYGESRYAVFQQGSAIKAGDLNGNLELLRLAIEEGANELDDQQDQIDDLNDEIDRLDDRIDQEIIDREEGDQNLQDQIDDIEINIDQIEGGSLDGRYVNITGDTMTGSLSMGNNKITNVSDPSADLDAVNLRTLTDFIDSSPDDPDGNKPSYTRYSITASGGETDITVPIFVRGGELVFINGAQLTRDVDYDTPDTVSVVLAQPLLAGDVFDLYCVNTLKIIEVPLGDTGNLPVVRENWVASQGDTTFTLEGGIRYTPGKEQIYLNGSLLKRDIDYTGNVPTTFVLTQGANEGDEVELYCQNFAISIEGDVNDLDLSAGNMTYQYPGGIERTVQNRLEDRVSVKDFGAVGDGNNDDTQAFKDAIATFKNVFIPTGRYRITSSLPYPGNHPEGGIIHGDGQESKLIIDIADANSPWLFEADMDDVSGNGYSWNIRGYTFRDFSVENYDDNTAYARKNGVFYFNGRTITANVIDNVHTLNVPQVAVHKGDTFGRGLKIQNCRFNLSTTSVDDTYAVNLWNYCSIEHTDIIGGWTWCCLIEGKTTIKNFNIGGQNTNKCGYAIYMRNTSDCLIENGYIEYCGRGQPSGTSNIQSVVLDNTYNSYIGHLYAMQGMNISAINCNPGTSSMSDLPARQVVELSGINYGGESSENARPHFKCVHPVFVSADATSIGINIQTINSVQYGEKWLSFNP